MLIAKEIIFNLTRMFIQVKIYKLKCEKKNRKTKSFDRSCQNDIYKDTFMPQTRILVLREYNGFEG